MENTIALIATITASAIALSTEARKWYTIIIKKEKRKKK
ncbi:hypothetical protein FRC0448_00578 [Corynebacterium diphtheriae]|nr:hypothetical protein FRC0448_00578 [Corynebacterium diphtheriae]